MEGAATLIARLAAWAATVIRTLVENADYEGLKQNLYVDTYWRIVQAEAKQIVGNFREFVKYWSCGAVAVKGDKLDNGGREAAIWISSTMANVGTTL